jgi:hypothetical protein
MRDIVIIPTYDRPEMLWMCLEYLSACKEAQELEIWIRIDNHDIVRSQTVERETDAVLQNFSHLPLRIKYRQPHRYDGNTFNIMESYLEAYWSGAEHVYLIEDDVIVCKDFFSWHRQAQSDNQCFCSVAWKCLKDRVTNLPYVVSNSYASIGTCFKRESLASIIEHAHHDYYSDLLLYCRKTFPGRGDGYTEQDGLIERIMVINQFKAVFPVTPHCFHVGWYGYHRGLPYPSGNLWQRYDQVKKAVRDPQAVKALSNGLIDVDDVMA